MSAADGHAVANALNPVENSATPYGWEIRSGSRFIAAEDAAYPTHDAARAALRAAYLAQRDRGLLTLVVTCALDGRGSRAEERLPARVVVNGWTPAEREALARLSTTTHVRR